MNRIPKKVFQMPRRKKLQKNFIFSKAMLFGEGPRPMTKQENRMRLQEILLDTSLVRSPYLSLLLSSDERNNQVLQNKKSSPNIIQSQLVNCQSSTCLPFSPTPHRTTIIFFPM
eukprot:TRINITY_DN71613_c0_g1_i1.p1 TRINITY_DN71613_c0_g1~~TRINITY_DN71613_c0_g1_i1.p1  ORF type:complete len:114 (-),score=14.00 TRINITY_DN71613_c0_g1_i1:91-432(-)